MQFTVPNSHGSLREFNPCHRPKGEGGGQFADKGQGNCYGGFRYAPDRHFVNSVKAKWDATLNLATYKPESVARVRREKKEMGAHFQSLVDKASVVIRLPPDVLALVAEDGRLKSQHESGHSRGALNPAQRIRTEDTIFGTYHDVRDRPIYGLMMEQVDKAASANPMSQASTSTQYGTAIVVLKDAVRARTTMMFGDSLVTDIYHHAMPTPITKMTYLAAEPANAPRRITSVDQFTGPYPEAQIHGGVSLRDIDRVVIAYSEVTPPVQRALRQWEEAGVKVRVLKSGKPFIGWRTLYTNKTITIDGKDATVRATG